MVTCCWRVGGSYPPLIRPVLASDSQTLLWSIIGEIPLYLLGVSTNKCLWIHGLSLWVAGCMGSASATTPHVPCLSLHASVPSPQPPCLSPLPAPWLCCLAAGALTCPDESVRLCLFFNSKSVHFSCSY